VARLLRSRGHEVWTPTLTGSGERAHLLQADLTIETGMEDVLGGLAAEELTDVVLVGHSSGAVVVTGVADRARERIRALIYLDGLIAQDGESLATYFTPLQLAAYEAAVAQRAASFPPPPAALFSVPDGPDAEWVIEG
jgi:pimeloyl-ACP methyl ester carboxylesterase